MCGSETENSKGDTGEKETEKEREREREREREKGRDRGGGMGFSVIFVIRFKMVERNYFNSLPFYTGEFCILHLNTRTLCNLNTRTLCNLNTRTLYAI